MRILLVDHTSLLQFFATFTTLSLGMIAAVNAHTDTTPYTPPTVYQQYDDTLHTTTKRYDPSTNASLYISKQEAANPNNFRFLSVNGRAVAYAIEPCNSQQSLIACAMNKLKVHALPQVDTYNVQDFYYPNYDNAKVAVVVVTYYGIKDDAVSAERYRVSFIKQPSNAPASQQEWHLVQYGYQQRCDRSVETRYWTKSSCP